AALEFLHVGERVPQTPQLVRLTERLGADAVLDQAAVEALAEDRLERGIGIGLRAPRGDFEEHVPGVAAGKRVACPGKMLQHEVDAEARDQLERGKRAAG